MAILGVLCGLNWVHLCSLKVILSTNFSAQHLNDFLLVSKTFYTENHKHFIFTFNCTVTDYIYSYYMCDHSKTNTLSTII